jgi:hypothetical protein
LERVLSKQNDPEIGKRAEKEASALHIVLSGNMTLPSTKSQFGTPDELGAVRKGSCTLCSESFSPFLCPRKCTECSKVVCNRCSIMPRGIAGRVLGLYSVLAIVSSALGGPHGLCASTAQGPARG